MRRRCARQFYRAVAKRLRNFDAGDGGAPSAHRHRHRDRDRRDPAERATSVANALLVPSRSRRRDRAASSQHKPAAGRRRDAGAAPTAPTGTFGRESASFRAASASARSSANPVVAARLHARCRRPEGTVASAPWASASRFTRSHGSRAARTLGCAAPARHRGAVCPVAAEGRRATRLATAARSRQLPRAECTCAAASPPRHVARPPGREQAGLP